MHKLSDEALLERMRGRQSAIYRLNTFDNSLIMDTLVSTKLSRVGVRRLGARTAIMNEPFIQKRAAQPFKRYEGAPRYELEDYGDVELTKGLTELARERKSVRSYTGQKLSLMHIAALLAGSYGVTRTEMLHEAQVPWQFRPVPSPGALYASEIYLVLINSDLPQGLYHYRPDTNVLEQLKTGDFSAFIAKSCGTEPYIDSAAKIGALVICTSMIERLYIKYGERTYKFMMIETGLLAQQLTLAATSLDLGTCMLGGYFDDEVHDFLGVDGVLESVQNVMVLGHGSKEA
jgi:SagB-type dehydrogenase family enzyme